MGWMLTSLAGLQLDAYPNLFHFLVSLELDLVACLLV